MLLLFLAILICLVTPGLVSWVRCWPTTTTSCVPWERRTRMRRWRGRRERSRETTLPPLPNQVQVIISLMISPVVSPLTTQVPLPNPVHLITSLVVIMPVVSPSVNPAKPSAGIYLPCCDNSGCVTF